MSQTVNKTKAIFKLIDESFSVEKSKDYALFIQLGFDALSYCILDVVRNKVVALKVFHIQKAYNDTILVEKVRELCEQSELLGAQYKSVSASFVSNKYTLIPSPLFEKEKLKIYLEFNHILDSGDTISSDYIKNIDSYLVFAIPQSVNNTLNSIFPGVKIGHFVAPLLENVLSQYRNQAKKKIVVHVQASHFEVMVTEGKKLLFFNTFQHQTSEDFIYYLLFVCEQLELNPEELELVLVGEIEKNSALYQIIFKYIRNVSFGKRRDSIEYSYKFDSVPGHFYYSLLSQSIANN